MSDRLLSILRTKLVGIPWDILEGSVPPNSIFCLLLKDRAWKSGAIFFFLFFSSIFQLFYCCSITVVCIFSPPLYPTPAKPISLPCFHPSPWFCPRVLYSSSWKPFSPLSLPPSPLAIFRLFLTSMSLVIFCLLFSSVDYVPVKGEIIWYLSLTAWLISLSIMLSSSIHAVAKGISSFFLSAAKNSIVEMYHSFLNWRALC